MTICFKNKMGTLLLFLPACLKLWKNRNIFKIRLFTLNFEEWKNEQEMVFCKMHSEISLYLFVSCGLLKRAIAVNNQFDVKSWIGWSVNGVLSDSGVVCCCQVFSRPFSFLWMRINYPCQHVQHSLFLCFQEKYQVFPPGNLEELRETCHLVKFPNCLTFSGSSWFPPVVDFNA